MNVLLAVGVSFLFLFGSSLFVAFIYESPSFLYKALWVGVVIVLMITLRYQRSHRFNLSNNAFLALIILVSACLGITYSIYFEVQKESLNGVGVFLFGANGDDFKYFQHVTGVENLLIDYHGVDQSSYLHYPNLIKAITIDGRFPYLYYIFNGTLHLVNIIFIFFISKRLFDSGVAKISTVLFVVYPENYLWLSLWYKEYYLLSLIICMYLLWLYRSKLVISWLLPALEILNLRFSYLIAFISSMILTKFSTKKILILAPPALAILIAILVLLDSNVINYFNLFFRGERLELYWEKVMVLTNGYAYFLLALVPFILIALCIMVWFQPFAFYPNSENVFNSIWVLESLAGIFWFMLLPFAFLGGWKLFKEEKCNSEQKLLLRLVILLTLLLILSFMFLTIRHRFMLTPFLLLIAAKGLTVAAPRLVNPVSCISYVSFVSSVYLCMNFIIIDYKG